MKFNAALSKKVSEFKNVDVRAFVSPKAVMKRCCRCKKTTDECHCLKPSPLLNVKERQSIVFTKSWLLGWATDDDDSDADTVSLSASSSEEQSEAEESFTFPEVGDRERFNDATLPSEDSDAEEEDDVDVLNTSFVFPDFTDDEQTK